jgi:hypothetical protein
MHPLQKPCRTQRGGRSIEQIYDCRFKKGHRSNSSILVLAFVLTS